MRGIGGVQQSVSSVLEAVPVSLGDNQAPGSCYRTTFYVLDAPSYHWLFGLPLLAAVAGEVLCAPRVLRFKLRRAGNHEMVGLPLQPRSCLPAQPVWAEFHATAPATA